MNKKLALFPMTRDLCAVARYSHLFDGYTLHAAVVLPSLRLGGKDICTIDGGSPTDIVLVNYSENIIDECDVVYIDYCENLTSLQLYERVIDCANKLGKDVVLSRQLSILLGKTTEVSPISDMPVVDAFFECTIPVLSVLTQGANTNQFAVELAIRDHFVKMGYNIKQVGTHESSQFFGFDSQPSFMYENRDAYQKILLFNQYIKNLTADGNPDLLILGVSEPVMKHNTKILQGLGVSPFIMTSAVRSDLSVYCMHYAKSISKYIKEVALYCNYRLDSNVKFFNIANVTDTVDDNFVKLNYTNLPSRYVMQGIVDEIEVDDFCIFTALENESVANACKIMEDMLAGNVKYML